MFSAEGVDTGALETEWNKTAEREAETGSAIEKKKKKKIHSQLSTDVTFKYQFKLLACLLLACLLASSA